VSVGVTVGVGVIVSVGVTVGVGVAIRLEIAPHPDNPGKSNKESNKMPALKNMFFIISTSFRVPTSITYGACTKTGDRSITLPSGVVNLNDVSALSMTNTNTNVLMDILVPNGGHEHPKSSPLPGDM